MADAESDHDLLPPRTPPRARNIVLVGFMATGKTTLGRLVARKAGFTFVDMDKKIEEAAGMSIPKIFELEGEDGFRARETSVLRELVGSERHVIATGGGVVTREENHPLLRDLGFVVWLHTRKKIIFDRVTRNPHRPLLRTADPYATIKAMVEERKPLYKAVADLKVKTCDLSQSESVGGILDSACWFFRAHFPGEHECGDAKSSPPPATL
ncbi:MAG: shikimate kinase [Verrucomicrobiales bacterium]